jgi:hypothetical protein
MVNCPRCGTAVREEKAFCHNCGAPMDAAKAERETPLPDFGATVLVPPRVTAPQPPAAPPVAAEVQPTGRATAPVSSPPAGVVRPMPPSASPPARRKSPWKFGIGFFLLLLFLMFLAFALAIVLD